MEGPISGKRNIYNNQSQDNIEKNSNKSGSDRNELDKVTKKHMDNKINNQNSNVLNDNDMGFSDLIKRKFDLMPSNATCLKRTSSEKDFDSGRETEIKTGDYSGCEPEPEPEPEPESIKDVGYFKDELNKNDSDCHNIEEKYLVDLNVVDSESIVEINPKLRIRPDVKYHLSDEIIDLLEEKIAVGFRDPRFVEITPSITDTNANQSEIPSKGINKTNKLNALLLVCEKTNIHKMIDLLITKTKESHPEYKDFININIRQALKSYSVNDDYSQIENLHGILHRFSLRLGKDHMSNKTKQTESKLEWSDKEYKALINAYGILGDIVEDQANRCLVVECKLQLKKAFNCFENPSEESVLLSRGQGGLDLGVASLKGGFEISSQILGCDDTKVRVFKNKKGLFQATLGNDMFKCYAENAIGKIDGKVFNNLEEFIDFYADKILLTMHKWTPGQKIKRSTHTAIKDKMHRKHLIREIPLLQSAFKDLNLLDMDNVQLKYGSKGKDSPLKIEREVYGRRAGGIVASVASINLSSTKWDNTFTKNTPLLEQLDNNPQWLSDYGSNYFNLSIPSDLMSECRNYLANHYPLPTDNSVKSDSISGGNVILMMSKRLAVLEEVALNMHNRGATLNPNIVKELHYIKKTTESLIKINYEEYKKYCESINIIISKSSKASTRNKAHTIKSEKNKLRGSKCSADMLNKMMVSHAKLTNMYKRSVTSLEPFHDKSMSEEWHKEVENKKEDLKEMSLDMSVPDIYVSESDREQYLMLKKKMDGSIQFDSVTSKLAFGPFDGVVHVRRIRNENEPNPDSDGKYLYITLRASANTTASVMESSLMSALLKSMGTLPPVDGESTIVIDPMAGIDTVFQGIKRLKIELFFVEGLDGKYHLQYKRHLSGKEVAVHGGIHATTYGAFPVVIEGAASKYTYHFEKESFGCSTMTYLMTRYNGWKAGNKLASWDAFLADKQNQTSLAKLMINMSTTGNNANYELEDTLDGVRSYYEDRAIKIDEKQADSAKEVLNDTNASHAEKQEARKVLNLYAKHNKDALTEKDYTVANNVIQKSAKDGSWETSFDELKKEYEHLKNGPSLPSSQQSNTVVKNVTDFIDATNKMKHQLEVSRQAPILFHRFLEKTEKYIKTEKTRLDAHKSTMKSTDIEAMEDKIAELEHAQSQLQQHVKIKKKATPVGTVMKAYWTSDNSTSPKVSPDSLSQFTKILEEYKVLCPSALDSGETGVLEHIVGTEKFTVAMASFHQLLEANHEAYLEEASSRFQDINPNKPKPYK